jgi:predicted permease
VSNTRDAAAVLALALGIAAAVAVFSLVDHILLRALPYAHAGRAVVVWNRSAESPRGWLSPPEIEDLRAERKVFDSVAAWDTAPFTIGGTPPERVKAAPVSANLTDVLGIGIVEGRAFSADEDVAGGPHVAVISDDLWARRFGRQRPLERLPFILEGRSYQVVGVMAPAARLPLDYGAEATDVLVPLRSHRAPAGRDARYLNAVARLTQSASVVDASSATTVLATRRRERHGYPPDHAITVLPVGDVVTGATRPALRVLLVTAAFLLLIACGNVANLVLARADERRRDFAVRRALGAPTLRLIRLAAADARRITIPAVVLGYLGAGAAVRAARSYGAAIVPRLDEAVIDWRAATVALVLGFLAVCVLSVVPLRQILTARTLHALRTSGDRTATSGRRALRAIGGIEIGLAFIVLVVTVLLTNSVTRLFAEDPLLTDRRVIAFDVALGDHARPGGEATRDFYRTLTERIAALPGVDSAGAVRVLPLDDRVGEWPIEVERRDSTAVSADWQVVTPGYFRTLGIPLLQGRLLTDADGRGSQPVVVVNSTFARRFVPTGEVIGSRLRLRGDFDSSWRTIVGVVADSRQVALDADAPAQMFLPHAGFPLDGDTAMRNMTIVFRARQKVTALAIERIVADLESGVAVARLRSMKSVAEASVGPRLLAARILKAIAAIGVLIAAFGVYSVVAYSVTRRSREMAVRLAIGASVRRVRRMLLIESFVLTAVALAAAVPIAAALVVIGRSRLPHIEIADPVAWLFAAAAVGLTVTIGTWIPARRVDDRSLRLRLE